MSDTNEQERGVRDMLQAMQTSDDIQAQIMTAAETDLKPQLDWLAARAIGPETRTQIVKAWLDGNRKVDLALQGIDIRNGQGRNWNQEVIYITYVWTRLQRSTKRFDRTWDWSR